MIDQGGGGTAIRAGITAGIITTLLQFTVNQARVIRLDILASQNPQPQSTTPVDFSPALSVSQSPEHSFPKPTGISHSFENSTKSKQDQDSLPSKIMNAMSAFTPVRKLSDEEYLEVLQKKRGEIATRLREIEEEEVDLYDSGK